MYEAQSRAMTLAGELRDAGYSPSKALKQAWSEVRNGDDDEDDDWGTEIISRPRKRSNPAADTSLSTIGIIALGGYLLWCAYRYSQTKVWSWQPWKTQPITRIRQLAESRVIRPPSDNSQIVTLIVP